MSSSSELQQWCAREGRDDDTGEPPLTKPPRRLRQHPQADHEKQASRDEAHLRQIDALQQLMAEEDRRHIGDHHTERRPRGDRDDGMILRAERSEAHTSELQSLMRTSYPVFCLKIKKANNHTTTTH